MLRIPDKVLAQLWWWTRCINRKLVGWVTAYALTGPLLTRVVFSWVHHTKTFWNGKQNKSVFPIGQVQVVHPHFETFQNVVLPTEHDPEGLAACHPIGPHYSRWRDKQHGLSSHQGGLVSLEKTHDSKVIECHWKMGRYEIDILCNAFPFKV